MRALLDINVLLALFDSDHEHHRPARAWLASHIDQGWASCVLTQNGFVRIISQRGYPNPITPSEAMRRLAGATATEHHEFWPCSISLVDEDRLVAARVQGPRQVTDLYLLALAVEHGGRFVTLDRSIPLAPVRGATEEHLVVL